MTLHGDPHQEAALVIGHIAPFRHAGVGHDLELFSTQCPHAGTMLHRQVSPLNLRVVVELCDRTLPVDQALFQHIDTIRHEAGEVDILLGQQNRQALLL